MSQQEHSSTEKQAIVGGERQDPRKTDHATVGAMLRQIRKEKGISIRDAAKSTNISASNLVAIEHENYADLPANTFTRGQVAIYANLLGIDGTEASKKFITERERHQQLNEQKGGKVSSMSAKKLAEPAHISTATLAVCILLLIVLFIAGFCLYTGWNPFSYLVKREQAQAVQLSPAPELEVAVPPTEAHPAVQTQPAEQTAPAPIGN
jgi:cytoskeletal protein RodZ